MDPDDPQLLEMLKSAPAEYVNRSGKLLGEGWYNDRPSTL